MNFKKLINGNSRFAEIVRFGLVGALATVLQYVFYVIFVHAVGVKAVPSSMISYALSFIVNFFLSSYFTFHTRPNAKKGVGFTLSHLFNMGLQTGLVAIFQQIVGKTLALLPAMAICIPVNYILVRFAFTSKIFGGAGKTKDTPHNESVELTDPSESLLQKDEALLK
ncbi:MAG: GtrA family protein [Muribaculaceae bacterium]|nr:GtrA family protein [Muribaculaceae bacterium]MDE5712679.1 GtrA family protein [Muribaculaceae bacterium]